MTSRTLTVTELNSFIKTLFETDPHLRRVSVEGEVSNMKRASSGHVYFTLKDAGSEISCIIWASTARRVSLPQNGDQILVNGTLQVYVQRGTYSIIVGSLRPVGTGTLFRIYRERLERLVELGLTDEERKKELPEHISRVGVVTSETGAVLHDIITTVRRLNPMLEVMVVPAAVQGEEAAESIKRGIEALNEEGSSDVIIIARGGGSFEDLWAFNEEPVIKAVVNSNLPVISAVGHETDVSLSDMVADLRAATPTAAAELVSGSFGLLKEKIALLENDLNALMAEKITGYKNRLDEFRVFFITHSPKNRLIELQFRLGEMDLKLKSRIEDILGGFRNRIEALKNRLEVLDPKYLLEKGYVFVTDDEGSLVKNKEQALDKEELNIHFVDGILKVYERR